jgi:predicted ATPase
MEYGNSFQALVEDYHQFLGNDKYIVPNENLTSIMLRRHISETEFVELEPEDLSHGELKRLGLYSWIKYNNLNDSIILIDEIENGLHPDWQYNIVRDLAEWGDNQYLLATHSFYLCEALTPRHVKIIEPQLSNPYQDNGNSKS